MLRLTEEEVNDLWKKAPNIPFGYFDTTRAIESAVLRKVADWVQSAGWDFMQEPADKGPGVVVRNFDTWLANKIRSAAEDRGMNMRAIDKAARKDRKRPRRKPRA